MKDLKTRHLMDITLTVDTENLTVIGKTPAGYRRIANITGGSFTGERLNGKVLPGADWFINRPDGVMVIDVRLPLETDDGAILYLNYQGRLLASAEVLEQLARGEIMLADEYSLAMTAKLEAGNKKYAWLNNIIAVGTGAQTTEGPSYSIYEVL